MYISSDNPIVFIIGAFIVSGFILFNVFQNSLESNFSIGEKLYSFAFVFIFFGSIIFSAISIVKGNAELSITAFTVALNSMMIFIGSAFLLDGIKKLKHKAGIKKFTTAPKYVGTIVGLKIAPPPIVSKSPAQFNHYGRYLHIVFKYCDNNGITKTCTSYFTYNEKEVTHWLNLDDSIQICVYNNKCTISTPIQNLKDNIDRATIEALLNKQNYD